MPEEANPPDFQCDPLKLKNLGVMRIRISLLLKKSKSKNSGKCPVYARCVMDGRRMFIIFDVL